MKPQKISLSVVTSISEISAEDWDACALDATGPEKFNPFLSHAFLSSLEESGSATKVSDGVSCSSNLKVTNSESPLKSWILNLVAVDHFNKMITSHNFYFQTKSNHARLHHMLV